MFVQKSNLTDPSIRNDVWRILCECDHEFLPPLSARESSVAQKFDLIPDEKNLRTYFDELLNQTLLTSHENGRTTGFMSFIQNCSLMPHLDGWQPSNYITTICVEKSSRGQGVCSEFYNYLLHELPLTPVAPFVSTRTWSTNLGHLRLLEKLGFQIAKRILNDRGPGVDTIYLARHTNFMSAVKEN